MELKVYSILLISLCTMSVEASLWKQRGFNDGKCYREFALIDCRYENDCTLNLYPSSSGELSLSISSRQPLNKEKIYGKVLFRFLEKENAVKAEIKKYIPYPKELAELKMKTQRPALAGVSISCSDKK